MNNLLRTLNNFSKSSDFVATIGTYDGVHLGHQKILARVQELAIKQNRSSLLIFFEPHPAEFLQGDKIPPRLTTLREKLEICKTYNFSQILCLKFNQQLQNILATEFVEEVLLKKLNIKYLVVGDDFAFGRNREGDVKFLQNYATQDFQVEVVTPVCLNGLRVSSTHIRQAIVADKLDLATAFLGRPYAISGKVSYGDQFGHILGFPTANIYLQQKALPVSGVYAVKISGLANNLIGAANIGTRPTVDGKKRLLEVHILDFDQNIYGKRINVEFIHKIRAEQKFTSLELLKQQINVDLNNVRKFFSDLQYID